MTLTCCRHSFQTFLPKPPRGEAGSASWAVVGQAASAMESEEERERCHVKFSVVRNRQKMEADDSI
eukprot:1329988-Amphidinium_carterae.1